MNHREIIKKKNTKTKKNFAKPKITQKMQRHVIKIFHTYEQNEEKWENVNRFTFILSGSIFDIWLQMMETTFSRFRDLISNINSQEELQSQYITVLANVTKVNKLFIDISIRKTELQDILNQTVSDSNNLQEKINTLLLQCDQEVDSIKYLSSLQNQVLNFDNLNLLPLEEFYKEANLTEEEKASLTGSNLMKKQMEFELQRFQSLQEQYKLLQTRSNELKSKIFTANKLYAPIITKLKELDEVVNNFKKLHPDLFIP